MKEPSIHITEKRFLDILKKASIEISQSDIEGVFTEASKYQLTSRKVFITSDRIEKKAKMMLSSTKGDAQLFAQLLTHTRKGLRHRGISIIKEGSRDWVMIKEIAQLAVDFCNAFQLEKRQGFIEYISIALGKMIKFSFNKVNSMNQGICDTYEAKLVIAADPNSVLTDRAHKAYVEKLVDGVGWDMGYKDQPENYCYFVEVASMCIKLSISPEVFIEAQFEALSFANGVPHPAQLTGSKAEQRAARYLFENKTRVAEVADKAIDFSSIRQMKKNK